MKESKGLSELFESSHKFKFSQMVATGILLCVLYVLARLHACNYSLADFTLLSVNDAEFLYSTSLSIISSIFAALTFTFFYKIKENSKIETLLKLSNPEFTKAVLGEIAHYKGNYYEDYHVNIRLLKNSHRQDIYNLELTYSYKKVRISKVVNAVVYRVNDKSEQKLPSISDECLDNEFVFYNDERDMQNPVFADSYIVKDLLINDEKLIFAKIKADDEKVLYSVTLKTPPKPKSFITYKVVMPFEKESYVSVTHEFPCLRSEVTFDYTDIGDSIILSAITQNAGITTDPVSMNEGEGTLRYRHNGWILQNSGYTFTWWRKNN